MTEAIITGLIIGGIFGAIGFVAAYFICRR